MDGWGDRALPCTGELTGINPNGILIGLMDETPVFVALFRHMVWANDQMLAACHRLDEEQLGTEVAGTYGRLSQTLIHIARAQGGYLLQLSDWRPRPDDHLEHDAPFPGVARIEEHLRFTGSQLAEIAARESPDRIVRVDYGDDEPQDMPAWVVLLQAVYHATTHRQQIATTLTNLSIDPPEPDFWAYWEALKPPQSN